MNVQLTEEELDRLIDRFGKEPAEEWICTLSLQKKAKGYKYKSDYAAILQWSRKDAKKQVVTTLARPEFKPHDTAHRCTCCALDHKWDCSDDPICSLPYEIPCRSFINSRRRS